MSVEKLTSLGDLTSETASVHMSTRVPIVSSTMRAVDIKQSFDGRHFDMASHIAVCEDDTLVGVIRIEDLFAAPPQALARELMDRDPPIVSPGLDQEIVARQAVKHNESALAVVDHAGRFVGFVPPQRLLAVLLWEHDEDIARLSGFLHDTAAARTASQEPIMRRFWHRVPWLVVGLLGAIVAADIVGWFETQLQEHLLLVFFIPGVVYLADAVGTQTEALVVRGLSVGVAIERILRREILTGVLVGIALALVFFPVAILRWGDSAIALIVSLTIIAACSMATGVALGLPWLLHHLGMDPAFGSGPLATVVQDLLSILIYFAIAAMVVGQ